MPVLPSITTEINDRFRQALSIVAPTRTKLGEFCVKYGIDVRNLMRATKNPGDRRVSLQWIHALVMEYGISADWIITGRGEMRGRDSPVSS
jgi:hypothetical protein